MEYAYLFEAQITINIFIFSLTRPEVMEELVMLTTKEPSPEVEERWRYKYPNVACELLTCDVPMLNEKLAGELISNYLEKKYCI